MNEAKVAVEPHMGVFVELKLFLSAEVSVKLALTPMVHCTRRGSLSHTTKWFDLFQARFLTPEQNQYKRTNLIVRRFGAVDQTVWLFLILVAHNGVSGFFSQFAVHIYSASAVTQSIDVTQESDRWQKIKAKSLQSFYLKKVSKVCQLCNNSVIKKSVLQLTLNWQHQCFTQLARWNLRTGMIY